MAMVLCTLACVNYSSRIRARKKKMNTGPTASVEEATPVVNVNLSALRCRTVLAYIESETETARILSSRMCDRFDQRNLR